MFLSFKKEYITFALAIANRGVAQLAARHVRDVEVGSSSLLTPTNSIQFAVLHKLDGIFI